MMRPKLNPLALPVLVLTPFVGVQAQDVRNNDSSMSSGIIEEVLIVGVRASERKARELERAERVFSSIISQDDAGNFADQNVAESLQRLPGLTLLKNEGEGRFVSLRGLSPESVSVSMNGSELATAGEDSRAFALDAIPSDMLGSIEVYKTLTPDQDLNSLAGIVNLKTISAFDRSRDFLRLSLQTNKQSYDDDPSPKISLSGTNKLLNDTVGVGYSLSWEKRHSVTYANEHTATDQPRYIDVNGEEGLIPFRYEAKQEEAERTRVAASTTIEYQPADDHWFKLNLSRTEFEDIDIALREYHRWGQANASEIVYYDPDLNLYGFGGTDLQHQFFIQEGKNITNAFSFDGEHELDGNWSLDYTLAASTSSWDKPSARRVQFRVRELPMLGTHGANYFQSQIVSPEILQALSGEDAVEGTGGYLSGYTPGQRLQGAMEFDNLFIEDSLRDDEVNQVQINLKKSFEGEKLSEIKVGLAGKERVRTRDKDRWSVVPSVYSTFECPASISPDLCSEWTSGSGARLDQFNTSTPDHPDIQYDFITYRDAERIIAVTSPLAYNSDINQVDIDSTKDDYELNESSSSIYVMAEFIPFDDASLIVGAKYEQTSFDSQGNFSIRNDREDDVQLGTQGDIVVPIQGAENSYSDILPSIHFKYEARNDLLVRAAVWTSFTRPGFDQARAYGSIASRVEFCARDTADFASFPESGCGELREFENSAGDSPEYSDVFDGNFYAAPSLGFVVGNPTLEAMTSVNYDASVTWYPNDDTYLQAAFFYKDISDFIVDVRGATLNYSDFPFALPVTEINSVLPLDDGGAFTNVSYAINGDKAQVYGVEFSFAKNLENGLFTSGNITLQSSSASLDSSIRAEDIALPYQADAISNITVGWENDAISIRLSSNYRDRVLEDIGICGEEDLGTRDCRDWADIYHDNIFSLDFKAAWEITDMFQVYFDATNLTDDTSAKYFQGNALSNGKIMYATEDFGSTYQIGLNIRFL